jgi:acetyl-CoA carboxylase, biotin carboxylase subunit
MKLLIANRGEIATRIVKSCIKLDIIPCGVYSEADKNSVYVKSLNDALNIGGFTATDSYLRMDKIVNAAKRLGCSMVHPGYGFLAENLQFSELCAKEGLIFVGPSPEVLKVSGDKLRAKDVASKVAPVLEGKEVSKEDEALKVARDIGYPVILKAARGGGGRGLRIAKSADDISKVIDTSRNESMISFGSDRLFIEKYLEHPRHIEVQILGDNSTIIQLGERECSVQRRHQKLIEETPSPALTDEMRKSITDTAIAIVKEMKYNSAGTVEFLFKNEHFYFMEVNSRIQVEHPVTEEVTGVDLVEQQLNIASGAGLTIKQEDVKPRGHAIECRINAEHPLSFIPFAGTITSFTPPLDTKDVRIDTALSAGSTIPPYYDSLIAKLICFADTRFDAIEKMKKSLSTFRISGIPTTIPFHLSALNDTRFIEGSYDTSFVDNLKPYSVIDGEVASAILCQLPRKIKFVVTEGNSNENAWMKSRFSDSNFDHYFSISRWDL